MLDYRAKLVMTKDILSSVIASNQRKRGNPIKRSVSFQSFKLQIKTKQFVKRQIILFYLFFNFFYFTKPKVLATFFLKQVRKKAKNLPRWLYRLTDTLVFLFCFGRCGTRCCKQQLKQVLTLYPHKTKILRRHKCAGSRKLFNVIADKSAITKCWIATSCFAPLAMTERWMDALLHLMSLTMTKNARCCQQIKHFKFYAIFRLLNLSLCENVKNLKCEQQAADQSALYIKN
jgi:hypothetical protein